MCDNLADKVKKLRKSMGLSQVEFAKLLGISRSYLGDIETGRNKGTKFSLINKLSNVTGKPIGYFSDGEIEIAQYEILDATIEMLINKGLISKDGKVDKRYKDMVWETLEGEIAMKMERRSKK